MHALISPLGRLPTRYEPDGESHKGGLDQMRRLTKTGREDSPPKHGNVSVLSPATLCYIECA